MKRKTAFIASAGVLLLAATALYSFDWPQKETESDSFYSYFGQLRGGTISSSLIFRDASDVKACEKGIVSVVIMDHSDDFGWFDSALGNTIIIAHKDQLETVYANLDSDAIPKKFISSTQEVKSGESLGQSGMSGWQEGESCLEFKVVDTKNATAVNPRILMPRIGRELPLISGQITLADKNGTYHNLLNERKLPSGFYSVYRQRQEIAVPAKTIVSVNGATVETISYDTLKEKNGKLGAEGNAHYAKSSIYPDGTKQLVANIQFPKGHTTLTITTFNILGQSNSISYNLDIY